MTRIVITDTNLGDGSHERAELGDAFEVTVADVRTEDGVIDSCADADGLLVQWAPITDRVLAALPNLRAVVRYGIGLDNIDLDAARRRGVQVSNVDDYCLAEVADHAVAAVYAHNRKLTSAARTVADQGWGLVGIDRPLRPAEDPVGIAGFGRIGRAVAERARALGFAVGVWDPYVTELPAGVRRHDTLAELAAASRHLTLHLPTTDRTTGMVGADVLAGLGPHGHLVNTARGALVDEPALLAALDAGTLGFASLDVFGTEPPTGVSAALAAHPRVLTTPHMAYLSTESLPALRLRAAQILRSHLVGNGVPA